MLFSYSMVCFVLFFYRILFVFHKNGHLSCKAKVQPPRLNGAKTGVFSTRSPHRPNAIGLTLAKLEKVEGNPFHFYFYLFLYAEKPYKINTAFTTGCLFRWVPMMLTFWEPPDIEENTMIKRMLALKNVEINSHRMLRVCLCYCIYPKLLNYLEITKIS